MPITVFISHAEEDDLFVDRLATSLATYNIVTWRDHANISPGSLWPKNIQTAIENCDCSICILSAEYVNSENCLAERMALRNRGKRIYPVRFSRLGGVPWDLEATQYVNMSADYTRGLQVLIQAIQADCTIGEKDKDGAYSGRYMNFAGQFIAKVKMVFRIKLDEFNKVINKFKKKLRRILGITDDDFGIDGMSAGSTILVISMPENLARFFVDLVQEEPDLFQEFELEKIELLERTSQMFSPPSESMKPLLESRSLPRRNGSVFGTLALALLKGVQDFAERLTQTRRLLDGPSKSKTDSSLYTLDGFSRERNTTKLDLTSKMSSSVMDDYDDKMSMK